MFHVSIGMENAAFEHQGAEVARILRELAERIENETEFDEVVMKLRDINGNYVGRAQVTR